MQAFARNQGQMRDYMQKTMTGLTPMGQFEEMGKKNVAMFEEAMKMFMPFMPGAPGAGGGKDKDKDKPAAKDKSADPGSGPAGDDQLDDLRLQLEQMQQQIDKLTRGK